MTIIDDLHRQNYSLGSSAMNYYCNRCLVKVEYLPSFLALNKVKKSVQRLCGACKDILQEGMNTDLYQILECDMQDT